MFAKFRGIDYTPPTFLGREIGKRYHGLLEARRLKGLLRLSDVRTSSGYTYLGKGKGGVADNTGC